ncbi:MAG: GIY-YIG nuclease family protein [Alphaproteobacteria bacterium]|jgi:putative endonuclease
MKACFVYIVSNWDNRVIYTGVTSELQKRVWQHKNKQIDGFTQKYNIGKLVYYEHTENIESAILREKQIKKWRREKKNALIRTINPEWRDLYEDL